MIKTPNIYATGKWVVSTPFNIGANDVYVCNAIRSFTELRSSGIDPYEQYYKPLGISPEDFAIDERKFANIITLSSNSNPTAYIPDTYIVSYPDATSIPYKHVVMSISLGAVADTLVLTDIKQKVAAVVESDLGITGIVKEHHSGTVTEYLTLSQHKTVEANRLTALINNKSLYTQLSDQDAIIADLLERNQLLEEVITANGIV